MSAKAAVLAPPVPLEDVLLRSRIRVKPAPRIVALGGGTGLSTLLRGLKQHTARVTAVVAVTDEGGSSGRLSRSWGVLPPGDLRNCLVALAEDDTLISRVLQYRFPARRARNGVVDPLSGHSLGNLLLTGLNSITGSLDRAIAAVSQVLAIRGRVLPVSLDRARLSARLADGRTVVGEPRITQSRVRIRRVSTTPRPPAPSPGVLKSIVEADVVVLGPGSLYTSVIPPLLVRGVAAALAKTRALKVYVCNVMTQPWETANHTAEDHLRAVLDHVRSSARRPVLDAMIVNDGPFPEAVLRHYARAGSFPVAAPPWS
jgi:uncharacterized cofD-like protein